MEKHESWISLSVISKFIITTCMFWNAGSQDAQNNNSTLVFQDKYTLQMLREKAFTKTFGNKKNEISKPFNIIRNDELHGLHDRLVMLEWWARHADGMGVKRNKYDNFGGISPDMYNSMPENGITRGRLCDESLGDNELWRTDGGWNKVRS